MKDNDVGRHVVIFRNAELKHKLNKSVKWFQKLSLRGTHGEHALVGNIAYIAAVGLS
jgi:hypothetical protein